MSNTRTRVVAATISVFCAGAFWGCSGSPDENVDTTDEALTKVCQTGDVVPGIDVSKYQGTVDWPKVKASGVVFAFARTNDGGYIDPQFDTNWKGMKAAGIIRGAYQFFRNTRTAQEQAGTLLNMMGKLDDGDLPPVLDIETTSLDDKVSTAKTQQIIKDWINIIQAQTGRRPIVYTGSYFWRDKIKELDVRPVSLWIAHYTTKYCPLISAPWTEWTFHQWGVTEKGTVPGIEAAIDRDVFNGSLAELKTFIKGTHLNAANPSTPDASSTADAGPFPLAPDATAHAAEPLLPDPSQPPEGPGNDVVDDSGGCATGRAPSTSMGMLMLALVAFAATFRRASR